MLSDVKRYDAAPIRGARGTLRFSKIVVVLLCSRESGGPMPRGGRFKRELGDLVSHESTYILGLLTSIPGYVCGHKPELRCSTLELSF